MRFVIYGAGGVGGTIGARLFQSGYDVQLIARGAHGEVLASRGLKFVAPDGEFALQIPTVAHPREIEFKAGDMVLLTMKSQHTLGALNDLQAANPGDVGVVCGQNGVANERMALRFFPRVYGMLVNLPALHLEPGEVVTHGAGKGAILDTGCYPTGTDDSLSELTDSLSRAGFSAEPDPVIMRKKYAKLLMNVGNSLQAATQPGVSDEVHEVPPERVDVARMLRKETLACYAAAGIDCATAEEVRARHRDVYEMVELEGRPRMGGSSWQSIARGTGNIESDYLNGEIVQLGRLHGVPTPANWVCQQLGHQMIRESLPVGYFQSKEVKNMIEAAGGVFP
ncbi:MAG: ketopantoate reductase family protein [Gammaproteobacteria bacterium]|nr:ketopantoate reductase family protein [Gammaproteobacteria bacterium]